MYWDFIEKMTPICESEGFSFVKSLRAFRRKAGICEHRFQIVNYSAMQAGIDYGIRFKVIEEILSRIYQIKTESYFKTIFIIGNNFLQWDSATFFVITEEEIDDAVEKTKQIFYQHALPYFERYSTLEALNELINGEPIEENKIGNGKFHGPTLDSVLRGLITAKLLDRSDFPVLEEYYRTFMVERSRRLAAHLKEKSIEEFETCLVRFHEIDFDRYRKKIEQSA